MKNHPETLGFHTQTASYRPLIKYIWLFSSLFSQYRFITILHIANNQFEELIARYPGHFKDLFRTLRIEIIDTTKWFCINNIKFK